MVILGITGGIGSGKSLAAEFFRSRGAAVVDADQVARDLMAPGLSLLVEVAAAFGREVLFPDGSLDRRKLSRMVFGKPEAVAKLNALTHPPIMAEVQRRIQRLGGEGNVSVVCVVAPLLLEAGGRGLVDRLLVIWADEAERVRRVMARDGLSESEVRQRMAAQMPVGEQLRAGDWVVDTTAGREPAIHRLDEIWRQLVGRADRLFVEPR
jgi:dephospho-CoA kinase